MVLWPAAVPVADAMAKWAPGRRVVELGCGTGLVSMAALVRACVRVSACAPGRLCAWARVRVCAWARVRLCACAPVRECACARVCVIAVVIVHGARNRALLFQC